MAKLVGWVEPPCETQQPADTRDAIAHDLLAMIRSEREWDRLFSDPRSKEALKSLADEADQDEVYAFDPATRPATKAAGSSISFRLDGLAGFSTL